jgi:phage-related protein (TIGR01555 family)
MSKKHNKNLPAVAKPQTDQEVTNSYSEFGSQIAGFGSQIGGSQLSQSDTLFVNNRWYLISNFRQLLSEMYVEHGIIQTLVDQPVDDAFRSGFEIKSGELDGNDIQKLENWLERHRVIEKIKLACKWARLYGGGAVIPITGQNPELPFNVKNLKQGAKLEFKTVDMWELYNSRVNINGYEDEDLQDGEATFDDGAGNFYDYYGIKVHKSRVFRVEGKQPPSFIRPRLRGWGMSELEKIVRTFNQYLKNQNVIFELMDEAKVDVYGIKGLNSALATKNGTAAMSSRVQIANQIKNYLNALTMDVDDSYEQKTIQFTGLSEMVIQNRQGIAAELKMPITKLFGISAAGFSSGEDDIENYNSMLESEIRSKSKYIVIDIIGVACQHLFGFVPEDLMIQWNPLRILDAVDEETVKNHQFNRVMSAYQSGLSTAQEAKEGINKDSLLPIEIDEVSDALPPVEGDFLTGEGAAVDSP